MESKNNIHSYSYPSAVLSLFEHLNHHVSDKYTFFRTIAEKRREQVLVLAPWLKERDLSVVFSSDAYRKVCSSNLQMDDFEFEVEQSGLKHFQHWMEFWCAYEIYQVHKKYRKSECLQSVGYLPNDQNQYVSETIEDIASDQRLFQTFHSNYAMSLPDAITLINLDLFVRHEKWYEMLLCLHLSQSGTHFLLTHHSQAHPYPIIISSALIQGWNRRSDWLSYHPSFQSPRWNFCLENQRQMELEQVFMLQGVEPQAFSNVADFEHDFESRLHNKEEICEILRLTISGEDRQKLFFLYIAQRYLAQQVVDAGFRYSLTIIDQPLMLRFYDNTHFDAYFHSSYCDINENKTLTFKGFWNNKIMLRAFLETDFRTYKRHIMKQRQKEQGDMYA
ncbi:acyl-homoserine-lactone synthase [Vibrio paucivorans]